MDNTANIALTPLLLRKGTTKLALYGIGHLRDEQLTRALERKELAVARPTQDADDWFNVLAVHQNRAHSAAGTAGTVKETLLPSCMDLVFWGHERECTLSSSAMDAPQEAEVRAPSHPRAATAHAYALATCSRRAHAPCPAWLRGGGSLCPQSVGSGLWREGNPP